MTLIDGEGSLFASGHYNAFDIPTTTKNCQKDYGMTPDFNFVMSEFGGYNPKEDFKQYTNIITVNGDMDPWLPGSL